ncbi:MAG: MarR family transcriptional regulator [Kiritimatiellaeota bacterium]|nr:MarR family transcriptional regulator [Kiritimatiellota bacterium]
MDTNPPSGTDASGNRPERPPFNEISILFPLLALYTVSYLGLMAAEFVLRGAFVVPAGMMPVYIALVGAYAADKEIRRWAVGDQPSRKGALFVYLWMLFFLAAFLLHSFQVDFTMPGELSKVVLQVLGIFFGSRASKYIYANRRAEDGRQPKDDGPDRQAEILDMIKAVGKVTNRDVAARFQVSDTSANRLLADMTAQGLIRRMGERKATYYIMP